MKNPVTSVSSIVTAVLAILSVVYPNIFTPEKNVELAEAVSWIAGGVFTIVSFILAFKAKDGDEVTTKNF